MALIENKKARFEYELIKTYEAGAELLGHEVKAVRGGMGSLEGARVSVRGGETFLVGATIAPYQSGNTPASYDPERTRRLLLSAREIQELSGAESQRGLTIIPLKWYNRGPRLKIEIAVARRKKKYDKRETLKRRDTEREIARTLKKEY